MAISGFAQGRGFLVTMAASTSPVAIGLPSLDAHRAALQIVQGIEERLANGETEADIASVRVSSAGKHPFAIHIFSMAYTASSNTYAFEFIETAPNVEEAVNLP